MQDTGSPSFNDVLGESSPAEWGIPEAGTEESQNDSPLVRPREADGYRIREDGPLG